MAVVGEHHPAFEEYCECIFELAEDDVDVIQARIAERLNVSRPAVSEMMRRLDAEGLIDTTDGIHLTDAGLVLATKVVRRHRLAERFLTDVLQLSWAEAHHEAGKWEHVMSEHVEQAMDRLLGSPTTCPHGNPIPGSAYIEPQSRPLADIGVGEAFTISRITEELEFTPGLLEFLEASALQPGNAGTITAASPDGTVTVEIDGRHVGVGAFASARILVERVTPRAIGPALVLATILVACAETTIETPDTTAVSTGATTGSAVVDPLAALSAETAALSAALIDNDGQSEALARIEVLWDGLRPEIAAESPDLLEGFDSVIQLVRRSVERRRPADADKAHKNLLTLIAAYDG